MGLVDYISSKPFARAKKSSTYDEHFVVATISKIRNSMKHLIENKQNTLQKLNSILKLHSPSSHSKQSIAPKMHTPINTNSQISIKLVAPQSLLSRKKLPFVPQLTLSDSTVNLHIIYYWHCKCLLKLGNHISHQITTQIVHKAVKMSDNKECDYSEQINPIKPINGNKSNNPHKYSKFSAKT